MPTRSRIAVAGATGRVGRHVVDVLAERGHDVVRVSRSDGVDVITGEGLDAALAGVEGIVDAATGPSPEVRAATEFFTTAARNLQEAGRRAGVQRIVGERGATCRGCARSPSRRARSPRRSPTWRSIGRRRRGRRSRSPGRARRASSRSRRGSSPGADRLRVEAVSDPVDAEAHESGVLLPGPGARLGGPTFEEWLDANGR